VVHYEEIKKDAIEIVLKMTEVLLFLCTVYWRRRLTLIRFQTHRLRTS